MAVVDIIIPVYNTSTDILRKTADSIIKQEYQDWRVIIVDDGSNAETATELDHLQQLDERFTIIHQKNEGVSAARNRGLDEVRAPLVSFCDSDDLLAPTFLSRAVCNMEKYQADVYVASTQELTQASIRNIRSADAGIHVFDGPEKMKSILDHALSGVATKETQSIGKTLIARLYPKVYKMEILQGIRMRKEVRISEDSLFSFEVYAKAKKVIVDSEIGYTIRMTPHSLSRGKMPQRAYDDLKTLLNIFYSDRDRWKKIGLENAFRMRLLLIFTRMNDALSSMRLPLSETFHQYGELISIEPFAVDLPKVEPRRYAEKLSKHKRILLFLLQRSKLICQIGLVLDAKLSLWLKRC